MNPQESTMTPEDEIGELLLRWEEAWEHGHDLSVEELCPGNPGLAEALGRQITALRKSMWMKKAGGPSTEEGTIEGESDGDLPLSMLGGRYRLDKLIAEGGFGRVYRGFDDELQREIAIKLPRPGHADRPEQADALLTEARRAAKLRHPGIVSVHDVGKEDGRWFIVADLIDGTNLADLIARERPRPSEAVRMVAEVADALHFAHERGFVHRDIKPANILIDKLGRPHITDFGIAITQDDPAREKKAISGTLSYMAPEQVANEVQLIDPRTDLYALGVILYEALAGRSPYQARTPTALREQILFRAPIPLRPTSDIRPELERVVLRCLAKHPADRYSSAKEVAEELRSQPSTGRSIRPVWLILIMAMVCVTTCLIWLSRGPSISIRQTPLATKAEAVVPKSLEPAPQVLARVSPPTQEELGRPAIDLLSQVDVPTASIGPAWKREGTSIVSPPDVCSRIVLPTHPPREYILRVVVKRQRGLDSVVLGLVSGDNQFAAIFDTGPGIVSGLALVYGAHLNNVRNETRFVGGLIPMDRPFTLLCVVRESGVHITGDGATIIDWKGEADRLSLPLEWKVPDAKSLFIGSQEGIIRFEKIELIPISR